MIESKNLELTLINQLRLSANSTCWTAAARIEALEAALRQIIDTRFLSKNDSVRRVSIMEEIARAALDKEAG